MSTHWNEVLADVRTLVSESAQRGNVTVSPETEAWLRMRGETAPTAAPSQTAPVASTPEPASGPTLEELAGLVAECRQCALCETRTQTVFGVGDPNAQLVFVGEAPGEEEDRQGEPFVGRAGQLLTDIIEKGMKLSRSDVYICNVLKCRPPGNRNPSADEMYQCEPYLVRQLELLQPKVICALGGFAAKQLLKTEEGVGRLRGRWHEYHGIPVRVTYHPSYVLRQSGDKQRAEKKKVWEDVQHLMAVLDGSENPR